MDKVSEGKIWDIRGKCPRCGSEYVISEYLYNVPLIGQVILSSGECKSCGYKYRDVRMAESHGPQRLTLYVETPEDLNSLVVRAATASIYIPELGISIEPGPASRGYISTVEGILDRVLKVMVALKDDEEVDREKWEYAKNEIEKAKRGESTFTLIIEDPEGVSRIISDKAAKERLYNPEDV